MDARNHRSFTNYQGSIIGLTELLLGLPRLRTVTASNICEVYEFQAETFAQLMANFPKFKTIAWQISGATLAYTQGEQLLDKYTFEESQRLFYGAKVSIVNSNEDIHIIGYTYLVHGTLHSVLGTRAINKYLPSPIPPSLYYFIEA